MHPQLAWSPSQLPRRPHRVWCHSAQANTAYYEELAVSAFDPLWLRRVWMPGGGQTRTASESPAGSMTCKLNNVKFVTLSFEFLGWFFDRVDLIKPVSNVRPCLHMYVHPSTRSFFDFNEIWHVGRGRWVMHGGMQYDPIQGQGYETLKVGNPTVF